MKLESKNDIYRIAIAGTSGSGKSTVALILRKKGQCIIDVDEFSKNTILESTEVHDYIRTLTNCEIMQDGIFNYKEIGRMFDENSMLENKFEEWFQIFLGQKLKQKFNNESQNNNIIFYDIPLVEQKGITDLFNCFWIIDANKKLCYDRIKRRNGYKDKKIDNILNNSVFKNKVRLKNYTVISNDGSVLDLEKKVVFELNKLLSNIRHS